MAKIIKLRGPIREFTVARGSLFGGGGGLLSICSSRVGASSRGGGQFENLLYAPIAKNCLKKPCQL